MRSGPTSARVRDSSAGKSCSGRGCVIRNSTRSVVSITDSRPGLRSDPEYPCQRFDEPRALPAPVVAVLPAPVVAVLALLWTPLLVPLLLALPGQHVVFDTRPALPLRRGPALRKAVETAPARTAEARAQAPRAVLGAGRPNVGRQNCCEGAKSDQDTHSSLLCAPSDQITTRAPGLCPPIMKIICVAAP